MLPYGHCSGHGASKVLLGSLNLDPGLRPGFFGSRFGLSLEKGAAWRLPARRDSSSKLPIRASRNCIRVLHVQSTQLALKPFNAQFANRLPPT